MEEDREFIVICIFAIENASHLVPIFVAPLQKFLMINPVDYKII